MRIKKLLAFASISAVLAVPSAAFAQSSNDGYGGPGNVVAGIEQSSGPGNGSGTAPDTAAQTQPTVQSQSSGNLPFTGSDLGVLAIAGGVLLALGFGLRRLTAHPAQV